MSVFFCLLTFWVALICESHGARVQTITSTLRNAILNKHNYWRRKTAKGTMVGYNRKKHPSAKNMIELQWDDALAWSAANWAATCPLPSGAHDKDSDRINRFKRARKFKNSFSSYNGGGLGQNVAYNSNGAHTTRAAENRVSNWYDIESLKLNLQNDQRYGKAPCSAKPYSTKCGHFTQGIWAKTKYVGCGIVTGCSKWKYTIICNYYPSGNYNGVKIYEKGSAASACPSGWTRKSNGLCRQSGSRLTMEEEEAAEANRLGLILGLCGAALVLIIVGSVVFFCWRKKKKTHKVIKDEMEMGTKGETVPNESGEDEEEEIDVDEQETIEITV